MFKNIFWGTASWPIGNIFLLWVSGGGGGSTPPKSYGIHNPPPPKLNPGYATEVNTTLEEAIDAYIAL